MNNYMEISKEYLDIISKNINKCGFLPIICKKDYLKGREELLYIYRDASVLNEHEKEMKENGYIKDDEYPNYYYFHKDMWKCNNNIKFLSANYIKKEDRLSDWIITKDMIR